MSKCDKIKYRTEKAATRAMRRQQKNGSQVCRSYWCRMCEAWHLTSQDPEYYISDADILAYQQTMQDFQLADREHRIDYWVNLCMRG